jgi:hypothetical protein
MAGYSPAGTIPDYAADPNVRKTFDEWGEIFYPHGKPWWFRLAKFLVRLGFAVKDGKLVYDPSAYRNNP